MNMRPGLAVILSFLAGEWLSASSQVSKASPSFLHLVTSPFAALIRIPSAMTDAGILLCLGVCLVVISWVLHKTLSRHN